jgi:hypothetical protein
MNTIRKGSMHLMFRIDDCMRKGISNLEVRSDASQKVTACSPPSMSTSSAIL